MKICYFLRWIPSYKNIEHHTYHWRGGGGITLKEKAASHSKAEIFLSLRLSKIIV